MDNIQFSVGDILIFEGKKYRIIYIDEVDMVLCEMEVSKLSLSSFYTDSIVDLYLNNQITIESDSDPIIDIGKQSDKVRERYDKRRKIMNEVDKIYQPTYLGLTGRDPKPELEEILENNSISKTTFWRMCIRYLQSGMKDCSLLDLRASGNSKKSEYNYASKPGRKSPYLSSEGIIHTEETEKYFQEALEEYKSGRQSTIRSAYNYMIGKFYTEIEVINGKRCLKEKPDSEKPTWWQFYYYVKKHTTKDEMDKIKTSAREHRNDKRLLLGDSLVGVNGPGDIVEMDACEVDVSLVSGVNPNKAVGRPIVYVMIDIYTRAIIAASVSFDNNSILGITNLLLNLSDDKKELCKRYNLGFDNEMIWPSNIIPRRARVDRGPEFKSKEFIRICNELNIELQHVPGGTGSLKGTVEQSFRQLHLSQNVHLEDNGLIEKRYDSNHHKEASLTINEYTRMVLNFILTHNQKYMDDYPLTKEMIDDNIDPVPALLWDYGTKKFGMLRPISSQKQYCYNLMTPIKAKLSRKGISYKNLWYLPTNDPELSKEMFLAENKRIEFECRIDMRDVGAVYYIRNGQLIKAPLNPNITGNADYSGLTMKEYEDYLKKRQEIRAKGKRKNRTIDVFNDIVNAQTVDSVKKKEYSDDKNMRNSREKEKQAVSAKNAIAGRLTDNEEVPVEIPKKEKIQVSKTKKNVDDSFKDALEDFNEND